jgi:hypothetical protein
MVFIYRTRRSRPTNYGYFHEQPWPTVIDGDDKRNHKPTEKECDGDRYPNVGKLAASNCTVGSLLVSSMV